MQSDEVEKCRCPICGHFPQIAIDTYKIDTWVCMGRRPGIHGDDWYQDCCSCSPEDKERFYENFLAECYALRDEILDRLKSKDE